EVMWVDHFGNCQLNLDPDDLDGWGDVVRLRIGDEWRPARRAYTYADVADGDIGLIIDSYGVLSIALDRRPADTELGIRTGTEIRFQRLDDDARPPGVSTPVQMGRRRGEDT
ncbi:MAG: SAM hydroxide adenosyltransferase, partial [Acidimicrobiales bacterium]